MATRSQRPSASASRKIFIPHQPLPISASLGFAAESLRVNDGKAETINPAEPILMKDLRCIRFFIKDRDRWDTYQAHLIEVLSIDTCFYLRNEYLVSGMQNIQFSQVAFR